MTDQEAHEIGQALGLVPGNHLDIRPQGDGAHVRHIRGVCRRLVIQPVSGDVLAVVVEFTGLAAANDPTDDPTGYAVTLVVPWVSIRSYRISSPSEASARMMRTRPEDLIQ